MLNSSITTLSNTGSSSGFDLSGAITTVHRVADEVTDTLAFWKINEPGKVACFTLVNAANNDTCVDDLALEYGSSPQEWRILCVAHIFNCCIRAMLYGSERESLTTTVAADSDNQDDDE
ncbi:hypothetical protein BFJ71_g16126 [Fusarium oxysporum]|nr:hypothetical protein BFJ71_g16126 [Fusarium oxysporum]